MRVGEPGAFAAEQDAPSGRVRSHVEQRSPAARDRRDDRGSRAARAASTAAGTRGCDGHRQPERAAHRRRAAPSSRTDRRDCPGRRSRPVRRRLRRRGRSRRRCRDPARRTAITTSGVAAGIGPSRCRRRAVRRARRWRCGERTGLSSGHHRRRAPSATSTPRDRSTADERATLGSIGGLRRRTQRCSIAHVRRQRLVDEVRAVEQDRPRGRVAAREPRETRATIAVLAAGDRVHAATAARSIALWYHLTSYMLPCRR